MMVLVTYDVETANEAGKRRLQKVAKVCVSFGQRVQDSVFECLLEPQEFAEMKHRLLKVIDANQDSLRFYFLGANWKRRVEHIGAKASYDPEGTLIT